MAESNNYCYLAKCSAKFQKYFRIPFLQLKEPDIQMCEQKISCYVSPSKTCCLLKNLFQSGMGMHIVKPTGVIVQKRVHQNEKLVLA